MQAITDRNLLLNSLNRMMDRLCSPDLTAAEAKVLRLQLFDLLDQIHDSERVAGLPMGRATGARIS